MACRGTIELIESILDYGALLDAETHAFIARTARWYPPETVGYPIERQRVIYDAMCREFHAGHPAGVSAADHVIALDDLRVATREYGAAGAGAPLARVVYLHGGGFLVGGLDSHDDVCAELCAGTGLPITAVDYRLSPEHVHPAAFDDALAATRECWLRHRKPIILCGDSAGGNLAAAVAHRLRGGAVLIAGQVLIYPGLGGDITRGSYVRHANAPLLTRDEVAFYTSIRRSTAPAADDPTFAPLKDSSFDGLPPTVVLTAECDPLSDDGRDYCARITEAGGKAIHVNEIGLVHGFLRARTTVKRARESFQRIALAVQHLANTRWPW